MPTRVLEFVLALGLTLGSLLSLAIPASAQDISVQQAFARASVSPAATSGAIYFTLRNSRGEPDRLTAISTDAAEAAEFHATVAKGDVMTMEAVEAVTLPAAGDVAFAPGGLHVMLFGLKAPLKEGDTLTVTLTFEKSAALSIVVPVRSVAATGP